MRLFNGPIARFLRKYHVISRLVVWGGTLVGLYFLGTVLGLWDRFLF